MLFSLKDLAAKLSPQSGENLHVIKTNAFNLHHFQSTSGLVFILNTYSEVPGNVICFSCLFISLILVLFFTIFVHLSDLYANLQYLYSNIFVDYISRNPLYHFKIDEPINCPFFSAKVEEYLMSIVSMKQ